MPSLAGRRVPERLREGYLYCTLQLEARPCVVADTVREIGLSPSTSQELTMHTGIQLRILYQALISGPHPNSVQDTIFWRPAQALRAGDDSIQRPNGRLIG